MNNGSYIAISGGIGGAKLALGLDKVLGPGQLNIIANTGDDFQHFGLSISPDIDTLLYTLSELNNTELGWGRQDESWNFLETCKSLGMDTWFQLGDRDLALHVYRSMKLAEDISLSKITLALCRQLGIDSNIIPMSDSPVRTMLGTEHGEMSFQEYFVKNRCEPVVRDIYYEGADTARLSQGFSSALASPDLQAIIICPSNPFLSIGPVLALQGLKQALPGTGKPVILVSPVIDGQSIKGPTSKLMQEMGLECSVQGVADIYKDAVTHFIIDHRDRAARPDIEALGLQVHCMDILMNTLEDKTALAKAVLALAPAHGQDS